MSSLTLHLTSAVAPAPSYRNSKRELQPYPLLLLLLCPERFFFTLSLIESPANSTLVKVTVTFTRPNSMVKFFSPY